MERYNDILFLVVIILCSVNIFYHTRYVIIRRILLDKYLNSSLEYLYLANKRIDYNYEEILLDFETEASNVNNSAFKNIVFTKEFADRLGLEIEYKTLIDNEKYYKKLESERNFFLIVCSAFYVLLISSALGDILSKLAW